MKRLGVLVSMLVLAFCLAQVQTGLAETKKAAKPKPAQQTAPAPQVITGKVVQTMNSGGYTYAQLDNGKEKIWVAVNETKISKGQTVSFKAGPIMENFESKTLKRTFDRIIFSDGVVSGQTGQDIMPTGSKDKVVKPKEKIKVTKAAGADSYTVEGLYRNQAALNHKNVSVKGKVVKVSPGIMQRNWVHIQDGTGDAKKGTHNLVVTSTSDFIPAKGDTVTATGVFFKDKDFGSGYKYDIIVENATFVKE